MRDIDRNSILQELSYKTMGRLKIQCIYPKLSKNLIDMIDKLFASQYGFTDEELDFIINYDIKYRMGSALSGEDPAEEEDE